MRALESHLRNRSGCPKRRVPIGRSALAGFLLLSLTLLAGVAAAQETVDLHDLTWYVHVDLIDAGAGRDLAFWQGEIDQSVAEANTLLEGGQGPFDTPCCTRLANSVAVTTFGTPGDGLDVIDTLAKQNILSNFSTGSFAFLVDSMTFCGVNSPNAIGCARTPTCSGNGNDDPDLWMAVTVEAYDDKILPAVIAHERGHNTCLNHVAAAPCQVMQGSVAIPGNGGCMTTSECSNYRAGRTETASGLTCGCQPSAGVIEPDGTVCAEVANGVCSGGVCADAAGDAGVRLVASGNPGSASTPLPDDALALSAVTGNWTDLGQIAPTGERVSGLAYSTDAQILYGVVGSTGNDSIVTVDPETGDLISTIGSISNGTAEIVSMAYDPGATNATSDDRLVMLQVPTAGAGVVIWIDPASPSTFNTYGSLTIGPASEFTGLAYDSNQNQLFASSPFGAEGLYEINCPPSPCSANAVTGADATIFDGSLAFSADTGKLYQVGTRFSGSRTFFARIDPTTGIPETTTSLDVYFPGGLAAVPEPTFGLGLMAGVASLVIARRRRS